MKNQHVKLANKKKIIRVAAVLTMLAVMVCCMVVLAFAGSAADKVEFDPSTGIVLENGRWTKTYDGTATINAAGVKVTVGGVQATVVSAEFDSKNAADANVITVTYTADGETATVTLPAKIKPIELSWGKDASATVAYNPTANAYTGVPVTLPDDALVVTGVLAGEQIAVDTVGAVSFDSVTTADVVAYANVTLKAGNAATVVSNYTVTPVKVLVSVTPVEIVKIDWSAAGYTFVYGDQGMYEITANGYASTEAGATAIPMKVLVQIGEGATVEYKTFDEAYAAGQYGQVKKGENETKYTVCACAPNELYTIAENITDATRSVSVSKVIYNVTMSDAEYLVKGDEANNSGLYQLMVQGAEGAFVPESALSKIVYTYYDEAGNEVSKTGVCNPGVYTVVATLPALIEGDFENAAFAATEVQATLTITATHLVLTVPGDVAGGMIIVNENGISNDLVAKLSIPEALNRNATRGFYVHKEYTLEISGAKSGETFRVYIPVDSALISNPNCEALTVNDLYIYDDAVGTKEAANKKYAVSLSEDGAYYVIDSYAPVNSITFMIAPEYHAPFWVTAPGIALIILLALLILVVIPLIVGLKLIAIERSGKNPVITIETEGNVPEVVPVVVPDKLDDADACLEDAIDNMADALNAEVAPAVDEETADVDATEAVAEAMNEMKDEASAIDLHEGEEPVDNSEADALAQAKADALAGDLEDSVDAAADESADVSDAVQAAVAAAMAENFNESADATDAIALIDEAEEISPEAFREVVDAIVADAMTATMELPEIAPAEESAEEAAAEQPTEEATAEEAEQELVVCAVVADSVAEAFEMVTVDGAAPKAVAGTTMDSIAEAVNNAAETHVPANWNEDMTDEVKTAIVEELAARLLGTDEPAEETPVEEVAAPAEEAAPVEASDEDNDNDDNDNDDDDNDTSFGAFGSMPLDFIDAVAEAERYNEMLEQERAGEVQLVTRYRRSYLSRLAQSQGNVQDYYNAIKNALLSYKGVKNRISWNYESFNLGRTQVAKFNAKTRTLYLYMALDPEELVDTKYGFNDMSSKKKYAAVPVLVKIKGDRKFKHALELITKLCEEKLQLPKKKVVEEIDYRVPFKTTEELVNEGTVKMMVAAVPMSWINGEAVAQEEPVVETPVEETPVEETPVEEVPAQAEVVEDENQNA